jgi:hypothetical protein
MRTKDMKRAQEELAIYEHLRRQPGVRSAQDSAEPAR